MEPGVAGAGEELRIPSPIAAGNGIELRPVLVEYCAALYALIDSNRVRLREWLPWVGWSFGPDDLNTYIKDRERDNAAGISLTTAIFAEGGICGAVALHTINRRDRNTSIGYWLDSGYEGRGIMTQACRAIVTEGFCRYGLHRIEIRCATGNAKSSALARRLGFVEEGVVRDAEWLHDRWVDLRVFGMLEREWK
jgi:ribosomal-protein-serine acetyltransferase